MGPKEHHQAVEVRLAKHRQRLEQAQHTGTRQDLPRTHRLSDLEEQHWADAVASSPWPTARPPPDEGDTARDRSGEEQCPESEQPTAK